VELTISGKPMRLDPGDVGVIGSNEIHNAKNVGTTGAEYGNRL
jgi:quercetin dioxygenase-like cupin family protein